MSKRGKEASDGVDKLFDWCDRLEKVARLLEDRRLLDIRQEIKTHLTRAALATLAGNFDGECFSTRFNELHDEFKERLAGLEARHPEIREEIESALDGETWGHLVTGARHEEATGVSPGIKEQTMKTLHEFMRDGLMKAGKMKNANRAPVCEGLTHCQVCVLCGLESVEVHRIRERKQLIELCGYVWRYDDLADLWTPIGVWELPVRKPARPADAVSHTADGQVVHRRGGKARPPWHADTGSRPLRKKLSEEFAQELAAGVEPADAWERAGGGKLAGRELTDALERLLVDPEVENRIKHLKFKWRGHSYHDAMFKFPPAPKPSGEQGA